MSEILSMLSDAVVWQNFLDEKQQKGYQNQTEYNELSLFVKEKRYIPVCQKIAKGQTFEPPLRRMINKKGSAKKRIVYSYAQEENFVLKLLNRLLSQKYDNAFCSNLYSFRKSVTAKTAIDKIVSCGVENKYCYKTDVHDYFNSISADRLCDKLKEVVVDDDKLLKFLCNLLLLNQAVLEDGQIVYGNRGAMAGVPISPFFANLYLSDMDKYFETHGVLYARYSDDIVVFGYSEQQCDEFAQKIRDFLMQEGLCTNLQKEQMYPKGRFEFLGVSFCEGKVDLSDITIKKMQDKIRRKARSVYRWKIKKKVPAEKAVQVVINRFNKKFFYETASHDLNWSRWFFPLINIDSGLKKIDTYLQQYLRYVVTGRFNKANYKKTDYGQLKQLGYLSLVNEYYKTK